MDFKKVVLTMRDFIPVALLEGVLDDPDAQRAVPGVGVAGVFLALGLRDEIQLLRKVKTRIPGS